MLALRTLTITRLAAVSLALSTAAVSAGERHFTYVYEAVTAPKGTVEYEQWVTWRATRGGGNKVDDFRFRHEIEFGITDRFQLGFYLSDWRVVHSGDRTETIWNNVALEGIYNLTSPTTDWLGSALYGEVKVGDRLVSVEGKLLLQKNVGSWIFAYNASLEAEWEGSGLREHNGEFQQTLGVSYQVSPKFSVGAELLHEVPYKDWGRAGDHTVYVGPNVSYRFGRGFVTTSVLFQATGIQDEPDVQTRLIFGIDF